MSEPSDPPCPPPNKRRAYIKIAAVGIVLGTVLGALIGFVNEETLDGLRHHLTLSLIIAIVVIINVTSFLLFMLFWAIYQWIRRDFDPAAEE